MKIKQLGNGGGFDFNQTNSSFLINYDGTNMLFDCGFNIMNRLTSDKDIDIEKIDYVFISHMDEDHVGNLKMFIYWRYFTYHKKTTIICNSNIYTQIGDYLKDLNFEMIGSQNVEAEMFRIEYTTYNESIKINNIKITLTKCNHGNLATSGAIFEGCFNGKTLDNSSIFISADTKASKYIEEASKDCDLIFHDFSNWDFVTRNVHTCKTDFELEYSEEYKNKAIKYHTGDLNFNKNWQIVGSK